MLLAVLAGLAGLRREERTGEPVSGQTTVDLVLGLVLGLLIVRQLQSPPVRGNQRLPLILVVVGLVQTAYYLQRVHAGSIAIAVLAGSLILAATFGALRAFTVRCGSKTVSLGPRQSADRGLVGGGARRAPRL